MYSLQLGAFYNINLLGCDWLIYSVWSPRIIYVHGSLVQSFFWTQLEQLLKKWPTFGFRFALWLSLEFRLFLLPPRLKCIVSGEGICIAQWCLRAGSGRRLLIPDKHLYQLHRRLLEIHCICSFVASFVFQSLREFKRGDKGRWKICNPFQDISNAG